MKEVASVTNGHLGEITCVQVRAVMTPTHPPTGPHTICLQVAIPSCASFPPAPPRPPSHLRVRRDATRRDLAQLGHQGGHTLITGGADGTVRVWVLEDPSLAQSFTPEVRYGAPLYRPLSILIQALSRPLSRPLYASSPSLPRYGTVRDEEWR